MRRLTQTYVGRRRTLLRSFTLLLCALPLLVTSCASLNAELYPPVPTSALEIALRETRTSEPCVLFIDPPVGTGWTLPPSMRGPQRVSLRFYRLTGGTIRKNAETIHVTSTTDTLLYNPSSPDAGWLLRLCGDRYALPQIQDLELEVEGTELTRRAGEECGVVRFRASYQIATSTGHSFRSFERGVAYIRRSPCESWRGLLVFSLSEGSFGELSGDWSPPEDAAQALDRMMESVSVRGS